jgi:hypothetical protein
MPKTKRTASFDIWQLKRADVMEYHLGDNVYLSAKYHNGVKVVDIRKYDINGEKRYPTISVFRH